MGKLCHVYSLCALISTFRPSDLQTFRLQTFRPSDLQTFRPSDFRPSDLQTFRLQTFRPSDLQTFRPSDFRPSDFRLQTFRPSDLQTFRPSDLQTSLLFFPDPGMPDICSLQGVDRCLCNVGGMISYSLNIGYHIFQLNVALYH